MKERRRSILHVDLDPFFVSVERSLDPSLRSRPVVIGGDGSGMGFVAAVSDEARQAGVRVGLPMAQAHLVCPGGAFRRGDLDAYGRHSEEVTAVLLAASRRVERPSADEAFVDLTAEGPGDPPPVRAAETIRDELQRRLGLDASLGLASSRLAARIASAWAKPRGLLVVLPGYEHSFLAGKPVSALGAPPHVESALARAGLTTVGQVADCGDEAELRCLYRYDCVVRCCHSCSFVANMMTVASVRTIPGLLRTIAEIPSGSWTLVHSSMWSSHILTVLEDLVALRRKVFRFPTSEILKPTIPSVSIISPGPANMEAGTDFLDLTSIMIFS